MEESGNATAAAMEINKKREAELFKLKQVPKWRSIWRPKLRSKLR